MYLILLRHGESQWNLENRFTGWTDVSLTDNGKKEAVSAGKKLVENNIKVDTIYTSLLNRAVETANIVADTIGFSRENIQYQWRLNERHYGALQGLNKSETAEKYGEKQVHIWRRSYATSPPLLLENDKRHPKFEGKFSNIEENLPIGESLKDVIDRLIPFWEKYVEGIISKNEYHLIVAHSNSLRAIIKTLDSLSSKEIMDVNIPTGIPLIYELSNKLEVINKKYLIDEKILQEKNEAIKKQGTKNG
jgi:2,3-bisphosphoglycerate-dependent phosphoglycerate mutase